MTNSPPGWHPDPGAPGSGRERYWDGSAWTEQIREGDATSAVPQAPGLDPTVAVPSAGQHQAATADPSGPPSPEDDELHAPTRVVAPSQRGPGASAAASSYPSWGDTPGGPTSPPGAVPGQPGFGSDPSIPASPAPGSSAPGSSAPGSLAPGSSPDSGFSTPGGGFSAPAPVGAPYSGAQPGSYPGQQPQSGGYPAQPPASGYPSQPAAGGYEGQQPAPSGYPGGQPAAPYPGPQPGPSGIQGTQPAGPPTATGFGGGGYPPPGGTAYGTGGEPPKSKKGLWLVLAGLATLLVIGLLGLLFLFRGSGQTAGPTTTTTATTLPATTTSSSTTTSTSTTSTSTTSTTAPKQPTTYADPSGRFKFTHPGWQQQPPEEGYTVFKVDPNGTDNLFGGRFEVKHSPGLVLNEAACAQQGGTIELIPVGGAPSKFCKALSKNKLVTVWAGFPAVGGTNVAVAYSALLQTDPAQAKLPADVAAAMASMTP